MTKELISALDLITKLNDKLVENQAKIDSLMAEVAELKAKIAPTCKDSACECEPESEHNFDRNAEFSALVGETLTMVEGMRDNSGEVMFACKSGKVFRLYHYNECCENVRLFDTVGDVSDLVNGKAINLAEEVSNIEAPDYEPSDSSHTWTFYRLQAGGCVVTLRWLGESNGYYSESVSFERLK